MAKGTIIVGAGPVELVFAGELRLGGADLVVRDELPAPGGKSGGPGFTGRTAEVFDLRGRLEWFRGLCRGKQGQYGGVSVCYLRCRECTTIRELLAVPEEEQ